MRLIIIGIALMLLSGCCSWCPDKIKEVYVKTGCLAPPVVVAPTLKINSLTMESTYKQTVEAYVEDTGNLIKYSDQLYLALEPYKTCPSK